MAEKRGTSPHSLLKGVAGGLLRAAAVYLILYQLRLPALLASNLERLSKLAITQGLDSVEAVLVKLAKSFTSNPTALLVLLLSITSWILGGQLLRAAWKTLTRLWGRRSRLILFALNVISTLFWILAIIALLAPVLGALAENLPYLRLLASIARTLDAALLAFVISALTPFAASLINICESRTRVGRKASLLLALGSLLYAASATALYMAWRSRARPLLEKLRVTKLDATLVSQVLSVLAVLASLLGLLLNVILVASILLALGFLGAWIDYWRASRGT